MPVNLVERLRSWLAYPLSKEERIGIGVDLGEGGIRWLVLVRGLRGIQLKAVASRTFPAEEVLTGAPPREAVIETLVELAEEVGLGSRRIAIGVSGPGVIVRRLAVPRVSKAEIQETAQRLAETQIPFPLAEISWDYWFQPGDGDTGFFVLGAVRNDVLYPMLDQVKEAGLVVEAVEPRAISVYNALRFAELLPPRGTQLVLQLGFEGSSVFFVQNGLFINARDVPIGVRLYGEALSRFLGLEPERALQAARGIPFPSAPPMEEMSLHLEPIHERLVDQVDRSRLDFLGEEQAVEEIYLTGEGARIPRLREFLEQRFQTPVRVLNPLAGFRGKALEEVSEGEGPAFSAALGLALRKLATPPIPLNLLPPEERLLIARPFAMRAFVPLLAFLALALVLWGVHSNQRAQIREWQDKLREVQVLKEAYLKRAQELKTYEDLRKELRQRMEVLSVLSWGRTQAVRLLDEINRLVPPEVWLTALTQEGGEMVKFSGQSLTLQGVLRLIEALESSPDFSQVQVLSLADQGESMAFDLRAVFHPAGQQEAKP